MNTSYGYDANANIFCRVRSHVEIGLKKDIGDRVDVLSKPNLIEKLGDAVLWTTGLVPRFVKCIHKTLQDPRIVTIVLTAGALFGVSMAFYPVTTLAMTKVAYTFTANLIQQIPFWSVKFSAYIYICASIVGAGLRATGRFNNAALMRDFYGISKYTGNPSHLYPVELASLAAKV